jgi:hypothetical protein
MNITPFVRQESPEKVALCRQGSCCTTIQKVNENEYHITDDFGGSVKLDRNDLSLLPDAAKFFLED